MEYLASYCHVLLRYSDNSDTRFFRLSSFGPNIEDYDQFESALNAALSHKVDRAAYDSYLEKHSVRGAVKILNGIN